ncbi:MAG: glycosyltransferase family 39 protein [Phycisphaerae bacterium]|nr:glycosyltransferase family 39 protein [Phycisphaerae bacterium]
MNAAKSGWGYSIFIVALTLRLVWVVVWSMHQGAELKFPDEELHWQLARNLVHNGSLVSDDGRYAARMPLYPLFLAGFAWAGQFGMGAARLAQALMGAATAWLAFMITHRPFGNRAAVIAGLLVACDPYGVFFCGLLLTEVLFTFVSVALVYAAWLVARQTREGPGMVGLALLGPLAILTRPSSAGWIVLLWIILWLLDQRRARVNRRIAICAVMLLLFMLPWGLRNRAVLGSFAWLSTNGGVTLYDAQGPQAHGDSDQTFMQTLPELATMGEVEKDRHLGRLAREQMWRDPARVVRLAGDKFLRTWSLRPNFGEYAGGLTGLVSIAFMVPVLIAAGFGVARSLRANNGWRVWWRRCVLLALLWLPILYFTSVHCVYVGSLRYRVPIMPFVEITAAAAFLSTVSAPYRRTGNAHTIHRSR